MLMMVCLFFVFSMKIPVMVPASSVRL
jgi:chemosensory pili system protein ChpA (sensor histidine kinase/response regulator)